MQGSREGSGPVPFAYDMTIFASLKFPTYKIEHMGSVGSEPEWTKAIPSWMICDWFYIFFVINAFVLVTLILSIAYMSVSSTLPKNVRFATLFMMVTQLIVSGTSTLFYYLVCDRSLRPSE
jgi:hypothetical protein